MNILKYKEKCIKCLRICKSRLYLVIDYCVGNMQCNHSFLNTCSLISFMVGKKNVLNAQYIKH